MKQYPLFLNLEKIDIFEPERVNLENFELSFTI